MRNFFRKRQNSLSGDVPVESGADVARVERPPAAPTGPRLVAGTAAPARLEPTAGRRRTAADTETRGREEAPDLGEPLDPLEDEDTELPHFRLPASGLDSGLLTGLAPERSRQLREAFTPTRPKLELNALFVGRLKILRRIIAAIEEERAHVVLYGDRGRGKTSLTNAVQQQAAAAGYFTLKTTCSAELDFESVFRGFLRRIPGSFHRTQGENPFAVRRPPENFAELLPEGAFTVTELTDVLTEIHGAHLLLILDEYDRVTNKDLRNKLAELIKNLTDTSASVTLFLVGVAEDVDHLLGRHPSIQRSLVAVHLPLMSEAEVDRILQVGANTAGIRFAPETRRRIVEFAKGLPYYAQLLALHAARSAVARGAVEIGNQDLAYAATRCVQEAERSVVEGYNQALGPSAPAVMADVLYAAAQARSDEFGVFHPAELSRVPLGDSGETLAADVLQESLDRLSEGDGGILQRVIEPGGYRYRFRNQMMRQYVLLRQARQRHLI